MKRTEKYNNNEKPEVHSQVSFSQTQQAVTLLCIAVEVFVVWVSVLVGDFWVDFTAGICGKTKHN